MLKLSARRISAVTASAFALAAAAAPSAHAGLLVSSATGCEQQALSQVFLPWLDVAQYTIAPDGDAEAAGRWQLAGGSAIVAGNESWHVTAASDSSALSLPAGSSATTGAMCVGIDHPTLRFFAKSDGTDLLSSLRVEVLFEDALGTVRTLPLGAAAPSASWAPTPVFVVGASLLPLLPGERTAVAFRFTPDGPGTWLVDDVYVDPYARH